MKKNIFAIILISILFSCRDNKETKAVNNTVIVKDTVVDTAENEVVVEEEEFKKDFAILLPRTYRTYNDVNEAASLNEKWLELYEENGQYYLGKAKFKIENGYDECVGDSTKSISPENKALIFIENPELKTGKIKSLKIDKNKIWPGEKHSFTFNSQTYTLRGEGKVLSEEKVSTDDDKTEIYKKVENYKLYLTAGSTEKLLLKEASFNDTFVELLFAGDIDGDGKLDFIFGANRDYEEERVILFLSSKAENGNAVKKVSEIAVQFDC